MSKEKLVTLQCCNDAHPVFFDEKENPVTAPYEIRKNIICPKCQSVVILSLKTQNQKTVIEQEVVG